jgi:phosphinothricin acetyltransferase
MPKMIAGPAPAALPVLAVRTDVHERIRPSLRLHLRAGFRVTGTRERISRQGGWCDTVLIERRSPTVGTD